MLLPALDVGFVQVPDLGAVLAAPGFRLIAGRLDEIRGDLTRSEFLRRSLGVA